MRNRRLFLLASFTFVEPLALLSKAAPADAIRALIDAVDRGELTGRGLAGPGFPGFFVHKTVDDLCKRASDLCAREEILGISAAAHALARLLPGKTPSTPCAQ